MTKDQEAFKNFDGWRKYTLVGEVNDGNTGMSSDGIAGHAGLYSNVKDRSILTRMMLNGGEINVTFKLINEIVNELMK